MSEPLAYFLTWTTYGTWPPGDERGWVKKREGFQSPDFKVAHEARRKLDEPPFTLKEADRALVEKTIRQHCNIRKWSLQAIACRTNHVHAVVSATAAPQVVMTQLRAWTTRRLKELHSADPVRLRKNYWTEGGSKRFLNDEASLEAAVIYVAECQ